MKLVALSLLIGKHASIPLALASSVQFCLVGHGICCVPVDWRGGIEREDGVEICVLKSSEPMTK